MDPEYDIDHESNIEEQLKIARWYAAPVRAGALERAGGQLKDLGYLAQLVVALDAWITHEGALPSRWMRNAHPQAAVGRRRRRQAEPDSSEFEEALAQIRELLWPDGDPDAEWDSETLNEIARVMYDAGFGPEERNARAQGKRRRREGTGVLQEGQIVEHITTGNRFRIVGLSRELPSDPWVKLRRLSGEELSRPWFPAAELRAITRQRQAAVPPPPSLPTSRPQIASPPRIYFWPLG